MLLHSLKLRHFRNHQEGDFKFGPHLNLILGPNARGKTSLLEAIYYLMIGRSFRSREHHQAIMHHQTGFLIEAMFSKYEVEQQLSFKFQTSERSILYNHNKLPSAKALIGLIQGVLITPDDLQLIKGPPSIRRQFLDIQLSQADSLYLHHLTRYLKAMHQRNHLLKLKQRATLDVWEEIMIHSACYIVLQREQAALELQQSVNYFYGLLTEEKEILNLEYRSSLLTTQEIASHYKDLLLKNRERECCVGHTLHGPHRDDLWIGLGKKEIRHFASEGQQRGSVIALHLAEWKRLERVSGFSPLFLIDDAGMSLDTLRKERLFTVLGSLAQVFVTSTDANLNPSASSSTHFIYL